MMRIPGFHAEAALYQTGLGCGVRKSPAQLPIQGVFPQLLPIDDICGGEEWCEDLLIDWAFGPGSAPYGTPITGGSFPVSGDDSGGDSGMRCREGYTDCTCDPGPPLKCTKDWVNVRCKKAYSVPCTPK